MLANEIASLFEIVFGVWQVSRLFGQSSIEIEWLLLSIGINYLILVIDSVFSSEFGVLSHFPF